VPFASRQLPAHTQRFAFRAPQEDDESVKMSNNTNGRPSVLAASDDARRVAILPALSHVCEGRPAPLLHAGRSLPDAGGALSSAFCSACCLQNHQFLFNTNEPCFRATNSATRTKQITSFSPFHANECLSRASNSIIHTKQTTSLQSTSFFLFNTNERLPITTHQSPITTRNSTKSRRTASPLRRGLVAVMLRRDFRGVTCN
jgi:hypothetical protein